MAETKIALLPDRGVVSVVGPDAAKLLQSVITNDMDLLGEGPVALHAGLLSPQGKVLFEFFVLKSQDGFCLETARAKAGELAERLNIYKLRANVDIADVSADYTVAAIWGGPYAPRGEGPAPLWFADPRLPDLGFRELTTLRSDWALDCADTTAATQDEYHAHRIGLGVPEGGKDYAFGDAFPHEALFDQLNGVSFEKGCYVGQEIVSRMQNRGTARRRIVPVAGDATLPAPGAPITAAGVEIGVLGSSAGARGLAPIRLDRAAEFMDKGEALHAGDVPIRIELPRWARFSLQSTTAGSAA
jgi:tRNA-modifying protein YgfZ